MFHLKIISAHDLSKKKITSYIEIVPKIEGASRENFFAYAVTEKVSKDTNPQYNEDILIPFYCFNTVHLMFYEKKLVGERIIARAIIPLNLSTFLKPQPITDKIDLYYPFDEANSTVTYSISYTPPTSILIQKFINPTELFVYLTYDPPLQLNKQEVRLFCKGVQDNGMLFDPSTNHHIRIEEEPTKCGPTGLTQVFYFDHNSVISGKFFFYIKSMNYTGKVTLNFATSPQIIDKENCHKYFCSDINSSVIVNNLNGTQNTYALFPIALLLKTGGVTLKPIEIAAADGIHNVPAQPVSTGMKSNDDYQFMKDYYTNHPEGIAQQTIFNAAVKSIHGFLPKSNGEQPIICLDAVPGRTYSLKSAFKTNSIENQPKKISVSISYEICVSQTYDVYLCTEAFERNEPVIFYDRHDHNAKVYFDYYDQRSKIKERIFFCLDRINKSMKYISLFARANVQKKYKGLTPIAKKNWREAYCILSDAESKVELMKFNLPSHDSPCGVFIAMFIRDDDNDDWKFMPVCKVFEPKNPYQSSPLSCIDSRDVFQDLVLSHEAK